MAEIRINATGGVKLYDADDSHYAQIIAGTITSNVNAITLGHDVVSIVDNLALTSDSAVLKFGADNDTTLTHTDGTGLTLNSTNKLCFNDTSQFIQGSSATVISIGATDEIDLTATAVDLNGTLDVSGTSQFNAAVTLAGATPTLTIGDAGEEDTKIVFDGNAQDFHIGLDDSSDDLVIGLGSTLGTTSHIVINEAGIITKPLQTYVYAYMNADQTVDADDNNHNLNLNAELKDLNSDFNTTTYTFTAPVDGAYMCSAFIGMIENTDANVTDWFFGFNASNGLDRGFGGNPSVHETGSGSNYTKTVTFSKIVYMDANDTMTLIADAYSGGSYTFKVDGSTGIYGATSLQIYLLG